MIIGEISDKDKKIELKVEIYCTNCGKKVPSGLKAGEIFSKTEEFKIELKEFMKNYLCGICRDKKRVTKLKSQNSSSSSQDH
ncbi:MAG: hypothetical protein ACW9XA_04980 [Candidatus Nitrosopumilus sp. bin_6a]